MDEFHRIAQSHEVASKFRRVKAGGVSMLLARLASGEPIAFGPVCPHQFLSLEMGSIWNDAIDCPNHHYTYDARTGRNIFPANVFPRERAEQIKGIPIYPVREQDGWIWVKPVAKSLEPDDAVVAEL